MFSTTGKRLAIQALSPEALYGFQVCESSGGGLSKL